MNPTGARIKSLMASNNIASLNKLSQLTHIPIQTLYRIVNKINTNPRAETIKKLCSFFKISSTELLGGITGIYIDNQSFSSTAEVLQFLMNEVCIGQNELARQTGITQQAINKILNAETLKPSTETLTRLSNFFGISIDQLQAKSPLDKSRIKGTINEDSALKKEIPIILWQSLPLLSDVLLSSTTEMFLSKFHGPAIFATKIPSHFTFMSPAIQDNDIIIVDFKATLKNGATCLIQSLNSILLGDALIKEDLLILFPKNLSEQKISLRPEQYRSLGVLIQVIKNDNLGC